MERLPGFRDFYPEPLPHQDEWSAAMVYKELSLCADWEFGAVQIRSCREPNTEYVLRSFLQSYRVGKECEEIVNNLLTNGLDGCELRRKLMAYLPQASSNSVRHVANRGTVNIKSKHDCQIGRRILWN